MTLALIVAAVFVVIVVMVAAGWTSGPARRAAGDRDGPRPVPVPGQVAPTHPAIPRPALFDWAVEVPELAEPTARGVAAGSGWLGRRRAAR